MEKIIVLIDGSEASIRALEAAVKLAKNAENSELHILNIQSPIYSPNVTRFFSTAALQEYYEDTGNRALEPAITVMTKLAIPYTKQVIVGAVAEVLLDYIKTHGCNHIVMGTRGLSAVPGLILGSVTTKVLHAVDIPVTLIK